jgi:hypothetical protein
VKGRELSALGQERPRADQLRLVTEDSRHSLHDLPDRYIMRVSHEMWGCLPPRISKARRHTKRGGPNWRCAAARVGWRRVVGNGARSAAATLSLERLKDPRGLGGSRQWG